MKRLLARSAWKILIMAFVLIILSSIFSAFYPVINNNMAMTQFENDDFAFAAFQMWQSVPRTINMVKGIAVGMTGISIALDVTKYFKTRKENETNENV